MEEKYPTPASSGQDLIGRSSHAVLCDAGDVARWSIPTPLDVPWVSRLRLVSSAEISVTPLDDGRIEQRIVHAALAGVTREMCAWWMEQLDRQIDWNGQQVSFHSLDDLEPLTGAGWIAQDLEVDVIEWTGTANGTLANRVLRGLTG